MKKYIKAIAAALLLAIPSVGHSSTVLTPEEIPENVLKDTINPSFSTYLNSMSGITNSRFYKPTSVKMAGYEDYFDCRKMSNTMTYALADRDPSDSIVTDKTFAIYTDEGISETYVNIFLSLHDDWGFGAGYASYCHRRKDGGAENITFHLLWAEE